VKPSFLTEEGMERIDNIASYIDYSAYCLLTNFYNSSRKSNLSSSFENRIRTLSSKYDKDVP